MVVGKDLRAILIKIVDRLHSLQSVEFQNDDNSEIIIKETNMNLTKMK